MSFFDKKEYIEYCVNNSPYDSDSSSADTMRIKYNSFFKVVNEIELKYNCDFAELSYNDAVDSLKDILRGGIGHQNNQMSIIRDYISWCIKTKKVSYTENVLSNFMPSNLSQVNSYKSELFSSEEELVECLNLYLSPLIEDRTDNLIRCFVYLLFTGLQIDEALLLKPKNINVNDKTLIVNNKVFKLSDEFFRTILYVSSMTYIDTPRPTKGTKSTIIPQRNYVIETSTPIKNIKGGIEEYRLNSLKEYLKVKLSIIFKQIPNKKITPLSILDSGVFVRMYKRELETGEIICDEYLLQRFERKNSTAFNEPEFVKRNCLKEYDLWKNSFNLSKHEA